MPRLNQLQSQYQPDGLEVLSVNYANTDAEIQNFITTYGANYSFARVVDDSGYTVPIASTCFAIDRDGLVLWTGLSSAITDQMVETWIATSPGGESKGDDSDEDEAGCAAKSVPTFPLLACVAMLVALAATGRSKKRGRVCLIGAEADAKAGPNRGPIGGFSNEVL